MSEKQPMTARQFALVLWGPIILIGLIVLAVWQVSSWPSEDEANDNARAIERRAAAIAARYSERPATAQ